MSTYPGEEEIRAGRNSLNGQSGALVNYQYYRMSPAFGNNWDPTAPWCKYWITGETGVSRRDLFEEGIVSHDQYKSNNWQSLEIEFNNLPFPVSKTTREYFRSISTINVRDNLNCKLAIYAGAHIDFEALRKKIRSCKSDNELSAVLGLLTQQVNVAAIHGAFAKLYNVVNEISNNPARDFTQVNQVNEDLLTNYYNVLMFGGKNSGPLDIPDTPQTFELPKLLYDKAVELEKSKKGLTPAQIRAELEPVLKKLINATKVKYNSKGNSKS
ncbi:MAG: hypothetical protein IJE91_02540 [Clostridia bacterium]|nr:hypothetical protein [Clostridia bacterium]